MTQNKKYKNHDTRGVELYSICINNTYDGSGLSVKQLNPSLFWKILLATSILIGVLGLSALGNLDTNISGDGIPNRPQREPPIEYPWDQAIQIIAVVSLSAITALYSWIKINR